MHFDTTGRYVQQEIINSLVPTTQIIYFSIRYINFISNEMVEEFKYFGTTLKIRNSFQEEIKSTLKLGNACYHSVQNLLSSSLLSKN